MAGNRVVNFHRLRSEKRLAEPHRAAGNASGSLTTGREKGASLQTLRVCGARCRHGRRLLRQHTRVRTLRVRTREPVRGRAAPFKPPGRRWQPWREPAALRRGGSAAKEGRSPLGSPLPWGMAGDRRQRGALRRPQALSSRGCAPLRESLTPPPRQARPLGVPRLTSARPKLLTDLAPPTGAKLTSSALRPSSAG